MELATAGSYLLEEELVLGVEEEDAEGTVEHALVDLLHQVAWKVSRGGMRRSQERRGTDAHET